ncbi:MAG: VapC toxin family PIN domain ribonuclease [Rickettsiales bacterium]|nr:MAG: VapC toxin family PIN domain ribonuclease [Rickettsiales bacterium]
MGVVIDTSVLIAAERQEIDFNKWQKYDAAYISSITITELLIGVHRAKSSKIRVKRSAFVEHIISQITALVFGEEEARVYAQILDDLYKKGITLGTHDMIIGASAIVNGYPVLTMNEKDFKRIPGLEVLSLSKEIR